MPRGQRPVPEPSSVELMEQFRAVAHAVHNRTNARMNSSGLSLARFRVLSELRSTNRMRMNELSSALGVVPRTVTTIIDSLETEGLLVRLHDPADRRATLLEITQDGLAQLGQLRSTHEATAAEVFDALTAVDKRQLVKLLRRLQAAARADSEVNTSDGIGRANPRPKDKPPR